MGISDADWKNQDRRYGDWALLLFVGGLVALYLYQWVTRGEPLYIGLAALLFAWGVVYVSDYWQPVLYLVMAVIVGGLTLFWLSRGVESQTVVQLTTALNAVFVAVSIYLFYQEEQRTSDL